MKKIVSFLTAAAICVSVSAPAFASGFSQSLNAVEANHSSINIIYNGQLMTYTDAVPENINDRVMLPFRAVLEGMGATVNYEDAARLVTASRGDISLSFTLLDDTIYINDNGAKSELKLDVPMIIKNDRTLVPIRFISNALGMQVGWEGNLNTVIIVDSEAYADDFEKNAPNLMALSQKSTYKYNTSALDLSVKFEAADANAAIGMKLDSVTDGVAAGVKGTVSADIGQLGISVAPVENAEVELITADGKLYIKTDLIEKLFGSEYSSPITDSLKSAVTGDRWFYVDVNGLVEKMFGGAMPDEMKDLYAKLLSGDVSSLENISLPDIITSINATEGDATLESALSADMMIDVYSAFDKHIKVTDNKVELNLTTDDFARILKSAAGTDEMKAVTDAMTFNVYAVSEYGDTEANSKADITIGINNGANGFKFTLNMTENSKQNGSAEVAPPPADAENLMPIIDMLIK